MSQETNTQVVTDPVVTTPVEEPTGGKTFTQAELDAIVGKRVNDVTAKQSQAVTDAVAKAIAEERRQAQLTQEQRDKEAEAKRQADLKAREDAITIRERKLKAQEKLAEKGVPIGMADFVVDLDEAKMDANIEKLAQSYSQSVEAGVTNKLKGNTPEDLTTTTPDPKKQKKKEIKTAF